jgi:hypothetical protein
MYSSGRSLPRDSGKGSSAGAFGAFITQTRGKLYRYSILPLYIAVAQRAFTKLLAAASYSRLLLDVLDVYCKVNGRGCLGLIRGLIPTWRWKY